MLELAHLIPEIPETIYVGINDAVCNKGLVTPDNCFVADTSYHRTAHTSILVLPFVKCSTRYAVFTTDFR